MFENFDGSYGPLLQQKATVLPSETWEQLHIKQQLPISATVVRYHTASITHRNLLQHSDEIFCSILRGSHATLRDFLNSTLLPNIYAQNDSSLEPILLAALDEMVANPRLQPKSFRVFVDGQLQDIERCVDANSRLLSSLFAKEHQPADFSVLPPQYTEVPRLSRLKCLGLAHEETPSATLMLACAKQLQKLATSGIQQKQHIYSLSQKLVTMLRSNLDAYLTQSSSAIVKALSRLAIFTKHTAASPTAAWQGTSLISLADSADGQYHSLVSTAIDVTDPAMGDTTHLRQQLGLQPGPVLVHVV